MQVAKKIGAATSHPGAKWGLWPLMEPYFSFPHRGFVDLFGGGGAITAQKGRVKFQVFNDLDGYITNFFRVARDRYDELAWKLAMTPYSREVYAEAQALDDNDNELTLAWKWYVSTKMSIHNTAFDREGWARKTSPSGSYSDPCVQFENSKVALYEVAQKFLGIYIETMDFRDCIKQYQDKDTLIYADTPYLRSTGRNVAYRVDFPKAIKEDTEWHTELAELMIKNPGFGIVSGVPSYLYEVLYENNGWKRVDLGDRRSNSGKADSPESLWLCPKTVRSLGMMDQVSLFNF